MNDELSFTIEIPCDDDGFVLMQCPQCGELFKLRLSDYESDEVLEVYCPACGIASDSYLTDEVVELAMTIVQNKVIEELHGEMKRLERKTRDKAVSLQAGTSPKPDYEPPLKAPIDALAAVSCQHCGGEAKVSRLLKMSIFVCPLCGVSNFNER
ncbi:MAG: TFIIB-type zinc ribbon-containing protein [Collinsella stercoris]|nr:TFIIB-type zinc ribbon-containing protein [Collinsella stercoris]